MTDLHAPSMRNSLPSLLALAEALCEWLDADEAFDNWDPADKSSNVGKLSAARNLAREKVRAIVEGTK